MYENVLVPLDGSKLAECVLPHVEDLSKRGMMKKIILLSVVEIPSVWITQGIDLMSIRKYQIENARSILKISSLKAFSRVLRLRQRCWKARRPTQFPSMQKK